MKKTYLFTLAVAVMTFAGAACSDLGLNSNDKDKPQRVKEREDIVLTKGHQEMVPMSNTFAFNFLTAVNKAECKAGNTTGNFMVSPLSMQSLLSLMTPGASDELAEDIIKGLGFEGYTTEELADYYKELIPALLDVDKSTKIWNANAIWVREPVKIDKKYQSFVQDKYGATAADMPMNGKEAADLINKWCSKNTNKMIDHIFDNVDDEIKMVLANALYFKGIWSEKYKFDESDTKDEKFTNVDGTEKKVKMMHRTFEGNAFCDDKIASVSLPFGNQAFSMRFIMPVDENEDINKTLASITSEKWSEINGWNEHTERYGEIIMALPRFESEYEATNDILKEAFNNIGLGSIFSRVFDKIASEDMVLAQVGQKTKIKVNETGAEAAAISWGSMKCADAGPVDGKFYFEATRPFIYVISECSTGAVLFAGAVKKL